MGARYAAASDLSSVDARHPAHAADCSARSSPTPCGSTRPTLMLDVQSQATRPQEPRSWQSERRAVRRSRTSPSRTPGTGSCTCAADSATCTSRSAARPPAGSPPTVFQDVRYPAGPGQPQGHRPELQRWKLASTAINILQRGNHVISSQAHPDKQLQPADPTVPGSPVVLGAPAASGPARPRAHQLEGHQPAAPRSGREPAVSGDHSGATSGTCPAPKRRRGLLEGGVTVMDLVDRPRRWARSVLAAVCSGQRPARSPREDRRTPVGGLGRARPRATLWSVVALVLVATLTSCVRPQRRPGASTPRLHVRRTYR